MPGTLTKRSDVVVPEILVEAIQGEFEGKQLLAGSGVAVTSNTLPNDKRGGDTVTVPYFETLGELEDIENEGDALTPEALSMEEETATVRHSGKAFEITEWARMSAAGDPYAEAARQFQVIVARRADKALIDQATKDIAPEFVYDASDETTGLINYDVMIEATGAWEDEQEEIALLGVHPKVYRDLLHLKTSTGEPLLVLPTTGNKVPTFFGIPVVVSKKCKQFVDPGDGETKYESIIAKRAALAFWYQAPTKVVTDYDALADTDLLAVHMYWASHRYKRVRGSTKPGVLHLITN